MNAEGIFALLFVALMLLRSGPVRGKEFRARWLVWVLAVVVVAAFWRFLAFPLLADDYSHIAHARAFVPHTFVTLFTVPAEDHFFRPLGYLSYALDAQWAGLSPAAWRAGNLTIHILCTVLVYALCRKLEIGRAGAFAGAMLFGIHGSRPEVVTWVAARFDLLAVLFGVACILLVLKGWRAAASVALMLAAMSKESAYVVPLLVCAVLWYQRRSWASIARDTWPLSLTAALVFVYRWRLLGGIGGYQSAGAGTPTVLQFRLSSTLKALFPRFWATLLIPVNWTDGLQFLMACCLAAALAGFVYLGWKSGDRRLLVLGIVFCTICSLPVHQFLSIGPDLEKARVLYFASIGLAIIFAALASRRSSWPAVAVVLLFQFAALQHNLGFWKRAGWLAEATCRQAAELSRTHAVSVTGLPNVVDGVYFLHTGFPECVDQQGGRLSSGGEPWHWDPQSRRLKPD